NLRIGATVGLAIERLATPKAKSIALIGSGRLAMPILEPAVTVRPIERVFVYSRHPESRESFARNASEKLKIPVSAVNAPEQAVNEADLVLVSTNSPVAALLGQWLIRLPQEGMISWDGVVEFSDTACEKVAVPSDATGVVVLRDSQGGYGDMALAAWAYEEARKRGLGQEISTD